ncbi:hypothetical protein HQ393_03830 [Chitinibacter bivalviorum]|uniref:Uncharacterized protein n=1 Tax=Chitinibacter bivalviorum TaxID=2739434 RepID=A0A7H9BHM3_9NEIS|nr:hypothetical protein [Chitinibacter bivalviorum]QLG87451.1 hypothetical protein HQ393_03830 [Chitinibacter bivalviorum]
MNNNRSKLTICGVLATSLMVIGMPNAQARLEATGKARPSIGRVSPAKAERPTIQRPVNQGAKLNQRDRANHKRNMNANNGHRNININNSHDIDINVDRGGGWGHHHDRWDDDDDWNVGRAVATTVAVTTTAAIIGSIIRANQLPTNCVQIVNRGTSFLQCGNTWYQPQYSGPDITYIVVNPPY